MTAPSDVEARIAAFRARYPVDPGMDEALAHKLRNRAGKPHIISDLPTVQAQLQRFLEAQIADPFAIKGLRRLTGGGSKEQFTFEFTGGEDGAQGAERTLILRLQPAEALTESSRVAEYQLMRAMGQAVPVPQAYWIDPEGQYFGHPAMIAEFVSGVTKPTVGPNPNVSGVGTTFGPEWRDRLKRPFVENLARIHNFDWHGADLSAFIPPTPGTTEGLERLLNWQDRIWAEDRIEPVAIVQVASRWLRDNMPVTDRPCVVHGDYRTGNFLFDESDGRITAVLDWELGRIGDHHEDLAYLTVETAIGQLDEAGGYLISGLMPRDEFLESYERFSGRTVVPKTLRYYEIVHALRGVQVMLSTAIGVIERKMTHQDVLCAWIAPMGFSYMGTLAHLLKQEL